MGQLENLRLFAAVIEQGSITRAAKAINIAKSAVSRRLAILEARYEATLIERGSGSWKITETGEELYRRAKRAIGEVDEIDEDFLNASANLSGALSVSVPRDFGLGYLNDALMAFKIKYPQITLAVDFDDRVVDLDRENYDFAIRITDVEDSTLSANQIGTMRHKLCASPNYLEPHSPISRLEDLHDHHLLHFGTARKGIWSFTVGKGKMTSFEFNPFLNSNSGMFLLDATLKGLGISRLPDFIVRQEIENQNLKQILPEHPMPIWGIFLLHSQTRQMNRRMRVFFEEMRCACILMG